MSQSTYHSQPCRIIITLAPFLPGHQQHDTKTGQILGLSISGKPNLFPPGDRTDIPWTVLAILDVRLTDIMRCHANGLFWTTDNIVLPTTTNHTGDQQLQDRESLLRASFKQKVRVQDIFGPGPHFSGWEKTETRSWRMREYPDRPVEESRWTGQIIAFAHDWTSKTMVDFDFGRLKRRHIYHARVIEDIFGTEGFVYCPEDPGRNVNRLSEKSPTDIWWLWPMESIVAPPRKKKGFVSIPVVSTARRGPPKPVQPARRDDVHQGTQTEAKEQINQPDCCPCHCHSGALPRVQGSYSDILKEICEKNLENVGLALLALPVAVFIFWFV
ncbi:hypothetical protein V8F20_008799 [Naviculisporaceae sp. PSN 640]